MSDRRQGDIETIYGDVTKAFEKMGWKAQKTLDDMTKSHWNWEKTYRDGLKSPEELEQNKNAET